MSDSDDIFDEGPRVPSVSWKTARRGDSITGVLVKPYENRQKKSMEDGSPMFWNDGTKQMQAILTIKTPYSKNEFTSDNFQDSAEKNPDYQDDGVRALFVSGVSLPKVFKSALRAARAARPEVGATITVTLKGKTPVPGKTYSSNEFEVAYQGPTEASRKVVAAWEKDNLPVGISDEEAGKGAWGGNGSSFDSEPPF